MYALLEIIVKKKTPRRGFFCFHAVMSLESALGSAGFDQVTIIALISWQTRGIIRLVRAGLPAAHKPSNRRKEHQGNRLNAKLARGRQVQVPQ
jgi:hypothetical protein